MLESRADGASQEEAAARLRSTWICAWLLLASGCTATQALIQCRHAEAALQHIDASGAVPERVYELTRARAYLDKAREEASEAHYGDAIRLAKASQDAADRARAPEEYGSVKGSF